MCKRSWSLERRLRHGLRKKAIKEVKGFKSRAEGLRLLLFRRGFVPGLLFVNRLSVKLLKTAPAVEVEKNLSKDKPQRTSDKNAGRTPLVGATGKGAKTFSDSGGESRRKHRADKGRMLFRKTPARAIFLSTIYTM